MEKLTVEDFNSLQNEEFTITLCDNAGEIKAVLQEVEQCKHETPDEHRSPFSLIFKCEPGTVICSGCHHVKNDKIDLEGIYLEALQPDDEGIYYQAVFS